MEKNKNAEYFTADAALRQIVSDFEDRLGELISKSEKTEPADEHKKFTWAAGHIAIIHLANCRKQAATL